MQYRTLSQFRTFDDMVRIHLAKVGDSGIHIFLILVVLVLCHFWSLTRELILTVSNPLRQILLANNIHIPSNSDQCNGIHKLDSDRRGLPFIINALIECGASTSNKPKAQHEMNTQQQSRPKLI
jgi:hypothetical protein